MVRRVGNNHSNKIRGTPHNDTLLGRGGNDRLYGLGGNDRLDGGAGRDRLYGGSDNDRLNGRSGADKLYGGGGRDSLIGGTGSDVLKGDSGNDKLTGNSGADKLYGGSGNDQFRGGTGIDKMYGGAGNDKLNGESGADKMYGGAGNDKYVVGSSKDEIFEANNEGTHDIAFVSCSYKLGAQAQVELLWTTSEDGNSKIDLTGNKFDQEIKGNAAANVIDGGAGNDRLKGLGGNDIYYVDVAGDKVIEAAGGGSDTVYTAASYTLADGQEIERLYAINSTAAAAIDLTGNEFAQRMQGNAGANKLNGAGGSDSLNGLLGGDTLNGGAGNDNFFFTTALGAANIDHITDFANASGNNDLIWLGKTVFTALNPGALVAGDTFAANANGTANANDTHALVIYNTTTGALIYDSNGSTAGGTTQFAVIDNFASVAGTAISAADFFVV